MYTKPAPTTSDIVELLRDPANYPEPTSSVEVVETHISWVFLADHFVYKLKKPVRFEFLDFSTPHARRIACEDEVRLNRRLAHNVYLAVLPVTCDERGRPALDGHGREIDCVVKMRRLPAEAALDRKIGDGRLRTSDADAVAAYLAEFYTQLPPAVVRPENYHKHLVQHCQANGTDLLVHLDDRYHSHVQRIQGALLRYLAVADDMVFDRVRDGRLVDGHGDLRAEHIYLESPPVIIDCIEFSAELRQVDVLDELCFLAMDCERLGNANVGDRVLAAYQEASGDHPAANLVAFYKSYRACVRAKVAALRAEQADDAEQDSLVRQASQYLARADQYAANLGPPVLIVVGGLMGSGKSTLAQALADMLGGELLQTDAVRRKLLGQSRSPADYGGGLYEPHRRREVYDRLLAAAEKSLGEGRSVVLDGTFLTNELRRNAASRGKQHSAIPLFVECRCPREVALSRIQQRLAQGGDNSEARPELYDAQAAQQEPPAAELLFVPVDTTRSVCEQLQTVCHVIAIALNLR